MTTEHSNDPTPLDASPPDAGVTGRLIRITAALAVAAVAAVAAVISYRHAYKLVTTHGETCLTARLYPLTVDGLILAASMLILDTSRHHPPPPLARWCLRAGIAATIGANLAHGLGHGPIGALVSAWPALALAWRLRTPHDPHPHRTTPKDDSHPCVSREPGCAWQRHTGHHPRQLAHHRWRRRYGPGTVQDAASAPSPATSASTAARSNASSTTPT